MLRNCLNIIFIKLKGHIINIFLQVTGPIYEICKNSVWIYNYVTYPFKSENIDLTIEFHQNNVPKVAIKMFRNYIEILLLSFNYFKLSISSNNVCGFFVLISDFNSISSHFNSISSHLIALTHLNTTEKLHRLQEGMFVSGKFLP